MRNSCRCSDWPELEQWTHCFGQRAGFYKNATRLVYSLLLSRNISKQKLRFCLKVFFGNKIIKDLQNIFQICCQVPAFWDALNWGCFGAVSAFRAVSDVLSTQPYVAQIGDYWVPQGKSVAKLTSHFSQALTQRFSFELSWECSDQLCTWIHSQTVFCLLGKFSKLWASVWAKQGGSSYNQPFSDTTIHAATVYIFIR